MVQRLGIAQALLSDPQLLVLDEPTSGLDPTGRKEVKDLIHTMKQEGKTIFLSSHILSEVEQICDRAIIINKGRLVRMGSLTELLGSGDLVEMVADHVALHDVFHGHHDGGGMLQTDSVAVARETTRRDSGKFIDVISRKCRQHGGLLGGLLFVQGGAHG